MELSLLDFFYQLREAGLPLSIEQYYCVARHLIGLAAENTDLKTDLAKIKRVCQTVWVKSPYQQKLFETAWQERLNLDLPKTQPILEPSPENVTEIKSFTSPVPQNTLPVPQNPLPVPQNTLPVPQKELKLPSPPQTPQIAAAVQWKAPPRPQPKDKSAYYPINRTQLEASWQQLRPLALASPYRALDIQATVIETAKQGFFDRPIYESKLKQSRQVVLLFDRSESMIPLAGFGRLLKDAWRDAPVYYFDNGISDRVYLDDSAWDDVPLAEILGAYPPEQTVCVIYSDAGAARGRYVSRRFKDTEKSLRRLTRRFHRVAWLNPLPSQRWFGNTAIDIADLDEDLPNFKMFALDEDFSEMVTWLKAEDIPSHYVQPEWSEKSENQAYYSLSPESRIAVLGLDYGQETLDLAVLGAFPLGLTPELFHYLRTKLKLPAPWYAVADILLSSLVHRVDRDLYEMDREVRRILLKKLEKPRLQELAKYLQDYIQQELHSRQGQSRIYAQTQAWTALAYLQPGQAATELKKALQLALTTNNRVRLVRLAALIDIFSDQLMDYVPLLAFAETVAAYARGDYLSVSQFLDLQSVSEETLQQSLQAKLDTIDTGIPLKSFTSETVYVDKTGEISQRKPVTAYYFDEPLETLDNSIRMMAIPEGEFLMGSPEDKKEYHLGEEPQHLVKVAPFFISQTPITQQQWRFVAKLPREQRELKPNPSYFKENDLLPVECVSWYDAIEFCARLSRHTGKNYRLPSEAEWEYACRAGSATPFHFGETLTSDLANYNGSVIYQKERESQYRQKTIPVGSFPPNAFGLYDMHGNVWEWCLDPWYGNYEGAPEDGRVWDEENKNDNRYQDILGNIEVLLKDQRSHVAHGGSWSDNPWLCRSACRDYSKRGNNGNYIGVRVVCLVGRTP